MWAHLSLAEKQKFKNLKNYSIETLPAWLLATQEEILASCGRSKTGDFSEYLADLDMAGFISRDFTWHLKEGKTSKLSQYRLKDNYVRFYLKYIQPNKTKVEKGTFKKISMWVMVNVLRIVQKVLIAHR